MVPITTAMNTLSFPVKRAWPCTDTHTYTPPRRTEERPSW